MLVFRTHSQRWLAIAWVGVAILSSACARTARVRPLAVLPVPAAAVLGCERCSSEAMPAEVTRAIEQRIADLTSRGASCSTYGEVLQRSYRERRISIRPFMWRVGERLVSGEAHADGEMLLAREIDSLNVGVRTVEDMMRTMEHEAVHIAFNISSGDETNEARVNAFVRACTLTHAADGVKATQRSPKS